MDVKSVESALQKLSGELQPTWLVVVTCLTWWDVSLLPQTGSHVFSIGFSTLSGGDCDDAFKVLSNLLSKSQSFNSLALIGSLPGSHNRVTPRSEAWSGIACTLREASELIQCPKSPGSSISTSMPLEKLYTPKNSEESSTLAEKIC